ncbi:hypothetical protein Scep_008679 [Stephania cephalantha]|uniref:Uncharacterized protein n=1 Tax=Stephania cephalantha TaxID=152367 RepID=A0AAP0KCE7_9MAGN
MEGENEDEDNLNGDLISADSPSKSNPSAALLFDDDVGVHSRPRLSTRWWWTCMQSLPCYPTLLRLFARVHGKASGPGFFHAVTTCPLCRQIISSPSIEFNSFFFSFFF